MKRKNALPELLAPAGDMECLVAAISAGADAVYLGGLRFGARAYAKNFDTDALREAVRLCHLHGVRIYVTLNTLIYDKEIEEALSYAEQLHEMGVDALIVADLGIASLIRERVPELELHASTQMGIHNKEGADIAYSLGVTRAVLARECSGEDIAKITAECRPEIEVFLHGALCVCHSGQCLFSSMVGGRSGNRGECAQPCRLPYGKGKYTLSLRDLSLSNHIKELVGSGVASLKIEGRMKSPSYVYEVTRIYRRLLDECRSATAEENKQLRDVFSRGGFTDGYFVGKLSSGMTGVRSEDDKTASRAVAEADISLSKIPLDIDVSIKEGEPSRITVSCRTASRLSGRVSEKPLCVTVTGDVPEEARSAPLTEEGIAARLSKLGATPFAPGNISVELGEGLNLSPSAINSLRRAGVEELLSSLSVKLDTIIGEGMQNTARVDFRSVNIPPVTRNKTAIFFKTDPLSELTIKDRALFSSVDIGFVPLFELEKIRSLDLPFSLGVYIPAVVMESEWDEVKGALEGARQMGAEYALVGNISHITLCANAGLIPYGDFRLNVTNKYTRAVLCALGVKETVLSPELTLPQARDVSGAVITLGRIPLMLTERCFMKESFGCDKCGRASLTDRKGAKFPMLREWRHRNIIFNSSPTYMADKKDELERAGIRSEHYIFSSESASEIRSLITAAREGRELGCPVRRIGRRQ